MTEAIEQLEDGVFDSIELCDDFDGLIVSKGMARVREEGNGQYVIYLASRANGLVDRFGLEIFRQFSQGRDYSDIAHSIRVENLPKLQRAVGYLVRRRLLLEK